MKYPESVQRAESVATRALSGQQRKLSDEAAITHSQAVTALLQEVGVQDEAILAAAMLHDVLEDAPEAYSREDMEREFGQRTADLVGWVSETKLDDGGKPLPWLTRKQAYIENIQQAPTGALLISAADKIHNLSSLIDDYETHGDEVWHNFKGTPAQQHWYYSTLLDIFQRRLGEEHDFVRRLTSLTDRLEQLLPPDQAA